MAVDVAQLQVWLDEALIAQHSLVLGKQTVEVSGAAGLVRFNPSSAPLLAAYISNLRSQIAAGAVTSTGVRPIKFDFC